jgi:hypothetical protein
VTLKTYDAVAPGAGDGSDGDNGAVKPA